MQPLPTDREWRARKRAVMFFSRSKAPWAPLIVETRDDGEIPSSLASAITVVFPIFAGTLTVHLEAMVNRLRGYRESTVIARVRTEFGQKIVSHHSKIHKKNLITAAKTFTSEDFHCYRSAPSASIGKRPAIDIDQKEMEAHR